MFLWLVKNRKKFARLFGQGVTGHSVVIYRNVPADIPNGTYRVMSFRYWTADAPLSQGPFCEGKAKIVRRQMRFLGQNYVGQKKIKYGIQAMCQRCHARGSLYSRVVIYPSLEYQAAFDWLEEKATEAWNRRVKE